MVLIAKLRSILVGTWCSQPTTTAANTVCSSLTPCSSAVFDHTCPGRECVPVGTTLKTRSPCARHAYKLEPAFCEHRSQQHDKGPQPCLALWWECGQGFLAPDRRPAPAESSCVFFFSFALQLCGGWRSEACGAAASSSPSASVVDISDPKINLY